MWLADRVELVVEPLDHVAARQEVERWNRVDLGELLRHLLRQLRPRLAGNAAADRLPLDSFHRKGVASLDVTKVENWTRHPHACLVRGFEHAELLLECERVPMDHARESPPHEQLPPVGEVDRPCLLRGTTGDQLRLGDVSELLAQDVDHSESSASVRKASTCLVDASSVVAPASRKASRRSPIRSLGPTSATSSMNPSGIAAAASRFFLSRYRSWIWRASRS